MNNEALNKQSPPENGEVPSVNQKQLGEQLVQIQGDRSLREYARAACVSPAALSQIIRGAYIPSRETLSKLASPDANPSGEVTLSELLRAAGYSEQEDIYQSKRAEQRTLNYRMLELAVYGIVYRAFVGSGLDFEIIRPEQEGIDILARIHGLPIEEWGFMLWSLPMTRSLRETPELSAIERFLFHQRPSGKRKYSIITNNFLRARNLLEWKDTISYTGELSVIIISDRPGKVVDEEYIIHDESRGAKIYLLNK